MSIHDTSEALPNSQPCATAARVDHDLHQWKSDTDVSQGAILEHLTESLALLSGLESMVALNFEGAQADAILCMATTAQKQIGAAVAALERPAPAASEWTTTRRDRAASLIKFLLADNFLATIDENAHPDLEIAARHAALMAWQEFIAHPSATAEEHVEHVLISTIALEGLHSAVRDEIISRSLPFVVSPVVAEWAQARIAPTSVASTSERGTA